MPINQNKRKTPVTHAIHSGFSMIAMFLLSMLVAVIVVQQVQINSLQEDVFAFMRDPSDRKPNSPHASKPAVYENTKYHYRFSYQPDEYVLNPFGVSSSQLQTQNVILLFEKRQVESPEPSAGFGVEVYPNTSGLSPESFLKKNFSKWLGSPSSYTDFNENKVVDFYGMKGRLFSTDRDTSVLVSHGDFLYEFNLSSQEIVDKIMPTFSFVQ